MTQFGVTYKRGGGRRQVAACRLPGGFAELDDLASAHHVRRSDVVRVVVAESLADAVTRYQAVLGFQDRGPESTQSPTLHVRMNVEEVESIDLFATTEQMGPSQALRELLIAGLEYGPVFARAVERLDALHGQVESARRERRRERRRKTGVE